MRLPPSASRRRPGCTCDRVTYARIVGSPNTLRYVRRMLRTLPHSSTRPHRPIRRVAVVTLAAGLLLAACGSDDADTTAGAATAVTVGTDSAGTDPAGTEVVATEPVETDAPTTVAPTTDRRDDDHGAAGPRGRPRHGRDRGSGRTDARRRSRLVVPRRVDRPRAAADRGDGGGRRLRAAGLPRRCRHGHRTGRSDHRAQSRTDRRAPARSHPRRQGSPRGALRPAQPDRTDGVQRVVRHRLEEPGDADRRRTQPFDRRRGAARRVRRAGGVRRRGDRRRRARRR